MSILRSKQGINLSQDESKLVISRTLFSSPMIDGSCTTSIFTIMYIFWQKTILPPKQLTFFVLP